MSTLVSTVAKISKLEQIARDASASSSSDSSTSSLGTLMKAAALNPWFQEARYILEQQQAAAAAAVASANKHMNHKDRETQVTSPQQSPPESRPRVGASSPSKSAPPSTATVAIFQSHQGANGEGHYVDYNSPQPVFLAPLASFTHSPHGGGSANSGKNSRPRSQSPPSMVPINMSLLSTRPPNVPTSEHQATFSGFPATICTTGQAIFLGKSSHYVTTQASMEPKRGMDAIEQTLAAEEEAKDEADRQAYFEEAFKCR